MINIYQYIFACFILVSKGKDHINQYLIMVKYLNVFKLAIVKNLILFIKA